MGIPSKAGPNRKRHNVLEHIIRDISGALERSLFAEEISARPGLLQSLDARVKLICTLAFLIGVNLSRSLVVIGAIYLFVLWLAWSPASAAERPIAPPLLHTGTPGWGVGRTANEMG